MKKLKTILILVLLAVTAINCNREKNLKCTDANTIKLPQHALDYFYFKKGSWWVYECEQTKKTDSFWVDYDSIITGNPVRTKADCQCAKGLCFQSREVSISNIEHNAIPPTNYFCLYSIDHYVDSYPKNSTGRVEISENNKYFSGFPGYRMHYDENIPESPTQTGALLTNIDSININGKNFKDVMNFHYPDSTNVPDWFSDAYYAKNIYIVKFIRRDHTTWNLIKYNIIK